MKGGEISQEASSRTMKLTKKNLNLNLNLISMGGKNMKKSAKKNKKGFTLIELLIVVAIIAILAAIAIPQFSAYRIKGYNAAAHSDLKNIVTAEEAYFVDNQEYRGVSITATTGSIAVPGLTGAKLSKSVRGIVIASTGTSGTFYTAGTAHGQGDRVFALESEQGFFKWASKTAGTDWDGATVNAATTNPDFTGTAM